MTYKVGHEMLPGKSGKVKLKGLTGESHRECYCTTHPSLLPPSDRGLKKMQVGRRVPKGIVRDPQSVGAPPSPQSTRLESEGKRVGKKPPTSHEHLPPILEGLPQLAPTNGGHVSAPPFEKGRNRWVDIST